MAVTVSASEEQGGIASDVLEASGNGGTVSGNACNTSLIMSGIWIQGTNGKWWYKHSDGSYTKNNWEYIEEKWYYFNESGAMLADAVTPDGYYVNALGQWEDFQLAYGTGISYKVEGNLWTKMYCGIPTKDSYIQRGAHAYEPICNDLSPELLEQLDMDAVNMNMVKLDYEKMQEGFDAPGIHLIRCQDGKAVAIGQYSKVVDQIQDAGGTYGGMMLVEVYDLETGKLLEERSEQVK